MPDFLLLASGDRLLLADGTSHLLLATSEAEPAVKATSAATLTARRTSVAAVTARRTSTSTSDG